MVLSYQKTDNYLLEGNPHLCVPLFAKLRFANSPLVALFSVRSISTSAEVDHRRAALDSRSLLEKSDAKTFNYQLFCVI